MTDPLAPLDPLPLPAGSRIACRVEYDGGPFSGWQTQAHPGVRTVQSELETALASVATRPVRVHCAGRTDTGVHGLYQIVHFESHTPRSEKAWVMGGNAALPREIRLHWARRVPPDFHARFSARSRSYRYLIANTPVRPALLCGRAAWQRYPLDAQLMHRESQQLLGEQDFSAFRAAACQSSTPMRNVEAVSVSRQGALVSIDIRANAFLHHMVRNIAGSLMAVGSGRFPAGWINELLAARDRRLAADTAPAEGLYLVAVEYPEHFQLPAPPTYAVSLGE